MQSANDVTAKKADEYVEKIGLEFQEDCLARKNPEGIVVKDIYRQGWNLKD